MESEVTSNGKAMIERLFSGAPHGMTTVYCLACDRLLFERVAPAGGG